MRRLVLVAALVACKSKGDAPAPPPPPKDAAAPKIDDTAACLAALKKAPAVPAVRRVDSIIAGCHPCGDWQPLLDWNKPPADGGPTRASIEAAMLACHAYCEPNAKQRFLGTLDGARGLDTRAPWRFLGEICKEQVSAVPDTRYMSAPYFALDRIARAAAATPEGAAALALIELPLPAVGVSGAGLELASSPVTSPKVPLTAITVIVAEVRVGTLPRAKLGASGVALEASDYPGDLVPEKPPGALATRLAKATAPFALVAPRGMAAARVAQVANRAGGATFLAVAADGAPEGWALPGIVPVSLVPDLVAIKSALPVLSFALGASADPAIAEVKKHAATELTSARVQIQIGRDATVASLAQLLGGLAYFGVASVSLVEPRAK